MTFTIKPNFIDIFKIGDNINYNLESLSLIYKYYGQEDKKEFLIKPIVIINTSIVEALLYDFIENRIKRANKTEKIHEEIARILRGKKLDKFEHYITQAEKYDFFDMKDTNFYNAMHSLRKIRNRIHIQNTRKIGHADEDVVFDEKSKILSEKVLEKTLLTLSEKYSRRSEYHGYVKDFNLPWIQHFKKK